MEQKISILRNIRDITSSQVEKSTSSKQDLLRSESRLKKLEIKLEDKRGALKKLESQLKTLLGIPIFSKVSFTDSFTLTPKSFSSEEKDIYRLGAVQHPGITSVTNMIKEHKIALSYAQLSFLPGVEAGPTIISEKSENIRLGAEVSLQLPLFDSGTGKSNIEKAELKMLAEKLIASEAKVVLNIHLAIIQLELAKKQFRKQYPTLFKFTKEMTAVVIDGVKNGTHSPIDELEAKIEEISMEIELAKIKAAYQKAISELFSAIGYVTKDSQ